MVYQQAQNPPRIDYYVFLKHAYLHEVEQEISQFSSDVVSRQVLSLSFGDQPHAYLREVAKRSLLKRGYSSHLKPTERFVSI